ncbi:S100 calcium binding protein V2 [Notolabrus celidotus]|uniref:S100 calcium binding protein V2 n=1 Tax=Notolabrus celidotus TaxID=1203425 RepID=UPI001490615A|nr:S100 calcium binding protein V2 [Notolabrus celidotus]
MAQSSDLEQAISTLVNQFHSASSNGSGTLKTDEFKNLLSSQMPNMVKGIATEQGLGEIMRKMGVADGEGISFKNFWSLIQNVATNQHSILAAAQKAGCSCILL